MTARDNKIKRRLINKIGNFKFKIGSTFLHQVQVQHLKKMIFNIFNAAQLMLPVMRCVVFCICDDCLIGSDARLSFTTPATSQQTIKF